MISGWMVLVCLSVRIVEAAILGSQVIVRLAWSPPQSRHLLREISSTLIGIGPTPTLVEISLVETLELQSVEIYIFIHILLAPVTDSLCAWKPSILCLKLSWFFMA